MSVPEVFSTDHECQTDIIYLRDALRAGDLALQAGVLTLRADALQVDTLNPQWNTACGSQLAMTTMVLTPQSVGDCLIDLAHQLIA
uniref:Uncharacterized protein n=1 Tax=Sphaerodactylus townsendi TaxID=933632 RepID=A0ACB8GB23_9SAUR